MMEEETACESLAILFAHCDAKELGFHLEERLQHAQSKVLKFIEESERAHAPLTGECYPEDRNRYCSVCISSDGGSARWPCGTIKRIWKYLRPRSKGRYAARGQ
jgi:hypothetical protein